MVLDTAISIFQYLINTLQHLIDTELSYIRPLVVEKSVTHLNRVIKKAHDLLNVARTSDSWGDSLRTSAEAVLDAREAEAHLNLAIIRGRHDFLEATKYLQLLQIIREEREIFTPQPRLIYPEFNIDVLWDDTIDLTLDQLVMRKNEVAKMRSAASEMARQAFQKLMTYTQMKLMVFVDTHASTFHHPKSLNSSRKLAMAAADAISAIVEIINNNSENADEAERNLHCAQTVMRTYSQGPQDDKTPANIDAVKLLQRIQVIGEYLSIARIGCDGLGITEDIKSYSQGLRNLRGCSLGVKAITKEGVRVSQKANDAGLAASHISQDPRIAVPLSDIAQKVAAVATEMAQAREALALCDINKFDSSYRTVTNLAGEVRESARTVVGEAAMEALENWTEKQIEGEKGDSGFKYLIELLDQETNDLKRQLSDAQDIESVRQISVDFMHNYQSALTDRNDDYSEYDIKVLTAFGSMFSVLTQMLETIVPEKDQTLTKACEALCEKFQIGIIQKDIRVKEQMMLDADRLESLKDLKVGYMSLGLGRRLGGFAPSGSVGALANETVKAVDAAEQVLHDCSPIIRVRDGHLDSECLEWKDKRFSVNGIEDVLSKVRDNVLGHIANGLQDFLQIIDPLIKLFEELQSQANPDIFTSRKTLRDFVNDVERVLEHAIKSFRALLAAAQSALEGFENACKQLRQVATENAKRAIENIDLMEDVRPVKVSSAKKPALVKAYMEASFKGEHIKTKECVIEANKNMQSRQEQIKKLMPSLRPQLESVKQFANLIGRASEAVRPANIKIGPEQLAILKVLARVRRNLGPYLYSTRHELQSQGQNFETHGIVSSDGWTIGFKKLSFSYLSTKCPWVTRDKHIFQAELLNADWDALKNGLGKANLFKGRQTFRIRNLDRYQKFAKSSEAKNHLVNYGLKPWRYSIHTYASMMPVIRETYLEKLARYFSYNILSGFIPGRTVDGLTASVISMRLKGQWNLVTDLFLKDSMRVSQQIRDANLGEIVGVEAMRYLIAELFQNRRNSPDFPAAATNLLIAYLRPNRKGDFCRRAGDGDKLVKLYSFLTDVEGAESNLELNAIRLAIIHCALTVVAADVQSEGDDYAKIVQAGVSAAAAITAAVAAGSQAVLTPPGASAIIGTVNTTRDLINAKIENRSEKGRATTTQFMERVRLNLIKTVEQNVTKGFIPGYYGNLTEDDLYTYKDCVVSTYHDVLEATLVFNFSTNVQNGPAKDKGLVAKLFTKDAATIKVNARSGKGSHSTDTVVI